MSTAASLFPTKAVGVERETADSDDPTGARAAQGRYRFAIYLCIAIGLLLGFIAIAGTPWQGSVHLHSLIEVVATTLSFTIGVLALVRYYSKKRDLYLFVGAGFIATGFLDGYHTIISSEWLIGKLPASLFSLIPWSWLPTRILLAGFLLAGTWSWRAGSRSSIIREKTIYVSSAVLAIATFLFFAFAPQPRSVFPEFFMSRPQELLPGLIFLLALIGYLRQGRWRTDGFEHWLIVSLVISAVAQSAITPFSDSLFDIQFDVSHLLKLVGYICVLVGLFVSTYKTFAEAHENAEHVATIVRTAPDGIVTLDSDGTVIGFNPAAESIFGYQAKEIVKKSINTFLSEGYDANRNERIEFAAQGGVPPKVGLARYGTGLRKDGTKFPVSLSIGRMVQGRRNLFTGIIRDVTREREAADRQERLLKELSKANEELENFAYIASHDLRAPLRGIDNLASWIEGDADNRFSEESLHNLQRLRLRIERLEKLLDGLHQFTQAGRDDARPEPVNCSEMVRSLVDSLALPDGFAVTFNASVREIVTSRVSLETVVRNLIANAVKHHDKTSGRIAVDIDDGGDHFIFRVTDDGPGIDPAYHERIFNIFQTLTPKSKVESSGIGLTIVRRLVDAASGTVTVQSPLCDGRGTAFTFTWGKAWRGYRSSVGWKA